MRRRIIKQGKDGFTIYLPKQWVVKKSLSAGDDVDIEERAGSLVISSSNLASREVAIDVLGRTPEDIQLLLTHVYRMGIDTIKLTSIDARNIEKARQVCRDLLLGFEMISSGKEVCVLENESEPAGERYEAMLRRLFLLVKEMQAMTLEAATTRTYKRDEMLRLKCMLDKYIFFCLRMISKQTVRDDPAVGWELAKDLLYIGHDHYYMYEFMAENKVKLSKKTIKMLEAPQICFDYLYEGFYKKDLKILHKIASRRFEFQFGGCYDLIRTTGGDEAVVNALIRGILRFIQLSVSPAINAILVENYFR